VQLETQSVPTVLAFGKQQIVIRFNRLILAPDRHPGRASINEVITMLSGLIAGTLASTPKSGTSASGTRWANTLVRVPCGTNREGEAETAFVSLACFGSDAEALGRLDKGDSITAQGQLKPTEYTGKDGSTRHGLSLSAAHLLTAYQVKRKRGDDQGKVSGRAKREQIHGSDREQNKAYAEFAKRATAPVHDGFGDSEIPF
jgi:single-strand DNA-binding protein